MLPAERTVETWLARAGYAISAAMYSVLAWSAMSFGTDERSAGRAEPEGVEVERLTRELMDRSAGRWSVVAIDAGLMGVGIYVVKGVQGNFHRDLEPRDVGPISVEAPISCSMRVAIEAE